MQVLESDLTPHARKDRNSIRKGHWSLRTAPWKTELRVGLKGVTLLNHEELFTSMNSAKAAWFRKRAFREVP